MWLLRLAKRPQNPSARQLAQQSPHKLIKSVFDSHKQRDGARRLQLVLKYQAHQHDVKTIARSMTRQHPVAKAARKFKATTDCL